ncbi:CinA family protein [Chryseobacterium sp. SIMBA_038]|uniref:CinA family protein n=1 Tax=Chryseobacterium sp. SIMBA_038 TaxID=3085780 RepID=UPI00397B98F5
MEFQKDLLEYIGNRLLEANESISIAESVTSGLLQFSFSQIKDASLFFKGGITAYTLEEKVRFLNIDRKEAEECDCVSQHIAEMMSLNMAILFKTDWSVGITGYATPVKESGNEIFAYFSFSYKGKIMFSTKMDLHPKTEALRAQLYYSEFILDCLKVQLDMQLEKQN